MGVAPLSSSSGRVLGEAFAGPEDKAK